MNCFIFFLALFRIARSPGGGPLAARSAKDDFLQPRRADFFFRRIPSKMKIFKQMDCFIFKAGCFFRLVAAARRSPLAARRSPLAARRSLLAVCCLLLVACCLPLAACHLPLAACRLPLAAYRSLCFAPIRCQAGPCLGTSIRPAWSGRRASRDRPTGTIGAASPAIQACTSWTGCPMVGSPIRY